MRGGDRATSYQVPAARKQRAGVFRPRRAAGFTLVEMLVAVGVFAIVVGLTSNLFLAASRSQTRTIHRGALEADARLIMERIAAELREGFVDATPDVVLTIRSRAGDRVYFRRASCLRPTGVQEECAMIGRDDAVSGTIAWAPLTGAKVRTDAFDIMVHDALQPFVTVRIALSVEDRVGQRITTEAQTTVVSRVYVQ